MDIRKLQRAIVDGLEDVKAQDIVVFNTEHLSPLFERVIIASGQSNRQTKALASSVRETVKKRGFPISRIEGEDNGEWIIVDCGAAVAHVMQPAIRQYYNLEEIWGGKPVKMALAGARKAPASKRPTAKESAPVKPAAAPAPAAKSAAPKKAAAKKAAPKKVAPKAVAPKTAAPKAAVRKTASTGKTTRTGGTVSAPRRSSSSGTARPASAARKTAPKR